MTYKSNSVEIPSCYDSFPDEFMLDYRDVIQMFGFSCPQSVSYLIKTGALPTPESKSNCIQKKYFKLGDIRKVKAEREALKQN